ncbi:MULTISPECIES: extracellular solute-binding protein [Trichocoleus]|uniref:Extracellular solute-binding protein n=1 Tax=Trichocoleus desertorum GB2-A4 TaxID=2933944 RepID=A0ABV0J2L4_9CYAN|nr:extracellular solute-binding protein [Trichocoleus sp. FACHB-46]MBD1860621.1 extracellular solute-binding protein [Trichocoleus sp. FACHB-46]
MDRRSFLQGVGVLGLSQALAGCNGSAREALRVRLLKSSIPPQILDKFRRSLQQPARLDFAPEPQLGQLFQLLQNWQRPAASTQPQPQTSWPFVSRNRQGAATGVPDLVTLGDYWLAQAIQQNLIQPLNPQQVAAWAQVPPAWQKLVTRDRQGQVAEQGQVWGMPYRWGTTVIAYRADKFAEQDWAVPTDWSDLWRPELRDRISLLDQPREVIGLTLKKLNHSYNTEDLTKVAALRSELQALHQQVKFYSSTSYLQPLILGDTWLAVGWSTDVLSLMKNNRQIAAVVPRSGTKLWSELWVRPAVATPTAASNNGQLSLSEQWLDFCLQPQTAIQLSILSQAASPTLVGRDRATLPNALQKQPVLLPEPSVIEKSEFLYPLSAKAIEQYQALWLAVRPTSSRG